MATLRKRKGIYYIRFQEMIDGERKEISRSLKTGRREIAEKKKELLEKREEEGQDPFSSSFNWNTKPQKSWWTVQDCYDGFIASKQKYRPATIRGYKYVIQKWMDTFGLRSSLITSVKFQHFERFLMRDGIKNVTRHSEKRRLSAFWNWCIKQKRVSINLISDIDLPQKNVEYRSKMISKSEMDQVVKAHHKYIDKLRLEPYFREWMAQDWFPAAMWTFYYTGARRSEIGQEKDDPKSGLMGKNIIGIPGKSIDFLYWNKVKKNRERFVPISKHLEPVLLDYFSKRGWPEAEEYVFLNGHGNPVTGRTMYYAFKKYLKDAELPKTRTIHGIRHKRATKWLEDGFTLKEVKDMMGHYSIEMTDQLYTHLSHEKLKEKMKRLEENEDS